MRSIEDASELGDLVLARRRHSAPLRAAESGGRGLCAQKRSRRTLGVPRRSNRSCSRWFASHRSGNPLAWTLDPRDPRSEGSRIVSVCRVSPGRSRSGSDIANLSLSRTAASTRSSPGEAVTLPHVRPAPSAGVLERAALEAVVIAPGVGLRRRRFAEQPAQVDEVLLRRGAFLQLRGVPLRDELVWGHRSPCVERLFADHPLNFTA